jgi:O-antigen ligase
MAASFALGLLVHATVGFFQVIIQNHVGLTLLGELPIPPDDPLKFVKAGNSLFLRAYGLTPHPNVLAGHLAIGLILCLGLAAGRRPVGRGLMAVIWTILFACLLVTFSRSGLLAALLGMITSAIWLSRGGALSRPRSGLGRELAVGAAVMIAVFAYFFSRYLADRIPSMDALQGSDVRFAMMNVAKKLIADHPVAGVGAGNYSAAALAANQTVDDAVHNTALLIGAELGLAGVAVVGTMVALLTAVGYRRWRGRSVHLWQGLVAGSLVGLVTISVFDHYLWTHPQGGLLSAWLVGWWLTEDSKDASA